MNIDSSYLAATWPHEVTTMACGTKCCVVLVALVAVVAYFGLQRTTVSFEFSVPDIKSDPQTVYEVFRDPRKLPALNPLMDKDTHTVEIVSIIEQEGGVEVVQFTVPIFWKLVVSITWTIDPVALSIDSDVLAPFGILSVAHEKWTFELEKSEGGDVRTVMTESTTFTLPRMLVFLANVFKSAHLEMAQTVKKTAESRQKKQ